MTTPGRRFRLSATAGSARVARAGNGVLVVDARDPQQAEVGAALLSVVRAVCGEDDPAPGDVLARRLIGTIIERAAADVPPFAALAPGHEGVAVLLTAGMELTWLEGDGRHTLSGRDTTTWLDRVVPWGAGALAVGVEPVSDPEPHPLDDLRDGVVAGGGAVLDWGPAGAPEEVAGEDETREQGAVRGTSRPPSAVSVAVAVPPPVSRDEPPPPPAAFEVVHLGEVSEAEGRAPLPVADRATADRLGLPSVEEAPPDSVPGAPLVDGVRCVRDHFNHPYVRYCAVCGIDMGQRTPAVVKGPRPPLGILIIDDGTAFTLDADYVIGREPELDTAVATGRARPLLVASPDRSVSRIHADLRLVGWDVALTDRGSVNGTFVLPPGRAGWSQVPARQSVTLAPRSRVAVGPRTFVYESHHVR
ncbi:MAG: FHA domain-containing protein [Acidimicrobiia bacterium]